MVEKELTGSLGELTAFYDVPGLEAGAVLLVGLGPKRDSTPVRRFRRALRWPSGWRPSGESRWLSFCLLVTSQHLSRRP